MARRMPKILRYDLTMLRVGTAYKRVRKDRDGWQQVDDPEADETIMLAYLDIRPTRGAA